MDKAVSPIITRFPDFVNVFPNPQAYRFPHHCHNYKLYLPSVLYRIDYMKSDHHSAYTNNRQAPPIIKVGLLRAAHSRNRRLYEQSALACCLLIQVSPSYVHVFAHASMDHTWPLTVKVCLLAQASPCMKVDCSVRCTPAIATCIHNPAYRPTCSYRLARPMCIHRRM